MLFSGTNYVSPFFLGGGGLAPLKMVQAPKRVPFFFQSREKIGRPYSILYTGGPSLVVCLFVCFFVCLVALSIGHQLFRADRISRFDAVRLHCKSASFAWGSCFRVGWPPLAALRKKKRAEEIKRDGLVDPQNSGNFHVHSPRGPYLSRKPPRQPWGNGWFLKRRMAENNGVEQQSILFQVFSWPS